MQRFLSPFFFHTLIPPAFLSNIYLFFPPFSFQILPPCETIFYFILTFIPLLFPQNVQHGFHTSFSLTSRQLMTVILTVKILGWHLGVSAGRFAVMDVYGRSDQVTVKNPV